MQGLDTPGRGTQAATHVGAALALTLLALAGCAGAGSGAGTTATTTTADAGTTATTTTAGITTHPDLDASLSGLVAAENRTAYARDHGLVFRDGRVEVVVELAPGRTLPADAPVAVSARHDSTVGGRVPVASLPALAAHRNVTRVRSPRRPALDSASGGDDGG